RVEVGRPVPRGCAPDVALLVGRRVLVDLDDPDGGIVHVLFEPVGRDENVRVRILSHGRRSFPGMRPGDAASGPSNGRFVAVCSGDQARRLPTVPLYLSCTCNVNRTAG